MALYAALHSGSQSVDAFRLKMQPYVGRVDIHIVHLYCIVLCYCPFDIYESAPIPHCCCPVWTAGERDVKVGDPLSLLPTSSRAPKSQQAEACIAEQQDVSRRTSPARTRCVLLDSSGNVPTSIDSRLPTCTPSRPDTAPLHLQRLSVHLALTGRQSAIHPAYSYPSESLPLILSAQAQP